MSEFHIRVPKKIAAKIKADARNAHRTLNGQINLILEKHYNGEGVSDREEEGAQVQG